MVIFHSYVKLPKGKNSSKGMINHQIMVVFYHEKLVLVSFSCWNIIIFSAEIHLRGHIPISQQIPMLTSSPSRNHDGSTSAIAALAARNDKCQSLLGWFWNHFHWIKWFTSCQWWYDCDVKDVFISYPLVITNIAVENHHVEWENPTFLWSFSVAMLT